MNHRKAAIEHACTVARARFGKLTCVVETGTIRDPNGEDGDGHSTAWFADEVAKDGGFLVSIDQDAGAVAVSRKVVGDARAASIVWIVSEAAKALRMFQLPAEVLYLDSAFDPQQTADEFEAAEQWLRREAVIVIDDTDPAKDEHGTLHKEGKGTILIPELAGRWGYQATDFYAIDGAIPRGRRTTVLARP